MTVVKVNPETSKCVRVGQPHTNARVTETALSTSAAFCVPKRRAIQSAEDVYKFTSDSDKQVSDADMYNIGSSDGASSDSCTSDESVVAVCTCGPSLTRSFTIRHTVSLPLRRHSRTQSQLATLVKRQSDLARGSLETLARAPSTHVRRS